MIIYSRTTYLSVYKAGVWYCVALIIAITTAFIILALPYQLSSWPPIRILWKPTCILVTQSSYKN